MTTFNIPERSIHGTDSTKLTHNEAFVYYVDYSKRGTDKCRRCKKCILKDVLCIGKLILFNKKEIKSFYHVSCIFKTFENARDVQNMITNVTQVSGFYDISAADKVYITELVEKLKPIHDRILLRKKKMLSEKRVRV